MSEKIVVGGREVDLDLDADLSFNEDTLVETMYNQAAKFAWWGTLYVQAKKHLRELETIAYARYEAHIKDVAKRFLEAENPKKKPTLEAIANKAIDIWSNLEEVQPDVISMLIGDEEICDEDFQKICDETFPKEFLVSWKDWQNRLVEAKFNVDMLGIVIESFRQRKDMLQSIGAMMRSEQSLLEGS